MRRKSPSSPGPQAPDTVPAPNCYKCQHLALTWQPGQPYLCRAMGFKSRLIPHLVVVRSSGLPCQLFSPKPLRPAE